MNQKVLKVADVDYTVIDAELSALEPPTVSLQEVLEQLDTRVREMQGKGVTAEQILAVLKGHGVNISVQRFRKYLATGKLPDTAARAARALPVEPGDKEVGF